MFVDVSLVERPPIDDSGDPLGHGDPLRDVPVDQRRAIEDFLNRQDPVRLVILGTAGSGKTTLLQRIARLACESDSMPPLPVLLYLRDHVRAIVEDDAATLPDVVRRAHGGLPVGEPNGWLERQLGNEQRCLVLLDGLDEVARTPERIRVAAEAGVRLFEALADWAAWARSHDTGEPGDAGTPDPGTSEDAPVPGITPPRG